MTDSLLSTTWQSSGSPPLTLIEQNALTQKIMPDRSGLNLPVDTDFHDGVVITIDLHRGHTTMNRVGLTVRIFTPSAPASLWSTAKSSTSGMMN